MEAEERGQAAPSPLRFVGRALAHRNYRLFFVGQAVSLVGTWMTRVASGWLVYRLGGGNPFLLGVIGFAGQVPAFFLAPIAGVLVDRSDRRQLLVVTQVLSLIQSALLAVVAFHGEPGAVTVWLVAGLSIFQGAINAFDMPARQVLLGQIIERREDLPNAIALNSFLVNGGRLVGPALAGVLIAAAGEAWCFALDAASYVPVIASLLMMRLVAPARPAAPARSLRADLAEGFAYAFGFPPVRALLLLMALVGLLGMPHTVLLPLFAADVLGGGPGTLGWLTAVSGVGALAGGLFLASRPSVLGLGRLIVLSSALSGLGLMGFAASGTLWLSLPAMFAVGMGLMVQMAACNTILQTISDEDKRGRVMSLYTMAFLGVAPFGSLLAGLLASRVGAPATVLAGGVGCFAGGLLFAWQLPRLRELVRPIYARLGVLPEVAGGMQATAELSRPAE